jgi:hypothetical protein
MLYTEVRRGADKGIRLFPHRFRDGRFGVTKKKGEEYKFLDTEEQVASHLAAGYLLRMSNKKERHSPSLIAPKSIHGWKSRERVK